MSLTLVRVDDRLIHGQVVEGWMRALRVDHVVVGSDEVSADQDQQALYRLAVPPEVRVTVLEVTQVADRLAEEGLDGERVLLLVASPQDALCLVTRLKEKGLALDSLNVGGIHLAPGRRQILPAVSLGDGEIAAFRELARMGVELDCRVVPDDASVNLKEKLHL